MKQPKHPIDKYSNGDLIYRLVHFDWSVGVRRYGDSDRVEYKATKGSRVVGPYHGINDREPLERLCRDCGIVFPEADVRFEPD